LWKCHPLFGIIIDWDDQDRKSRQLFVVVSPVAVGMTTEQQRNIVKFATTKSKYNDKKIKIIITTIVVATPQ
jgi:hypothetical protein